MKWLALAAFLAPWMLAVLLLPARRWDWPAAYLAVAIFLLGAIPQAAWLARHNPLLFFRRGNEQNCENKVPWSDRKLVLGLKLAALSIAVLAALDSGPSARWPSPWQLAAGLLLLGAGLRLLTASQRANRFFEAYVRLQSEFGHRPIEHGPYARLRHPGYLSYLLIFASGPFLLASTWAWGGVLLCLILFIFRIVFEEGFLARHLEGYAEYCGRVRYRLIPGVW